MQYQRSFSWCLPAALFFLMLGCGGSSNNPASNTNGTTSGGSAPASSSPSSGGTTSGGATTSGGGGTPVSGEVRLRARGEAVINGVEAELRGSFERRSDRTRLDGELEDINLPVGSAISFCLVQRGNTIPLAVGIIQLEEQRREAKFHIRTDDGQNPPNVQVGDVLQARDGASGNSPDCSRRLLVSATFVVDDSSGSGGSSGGGSSSSGSGGSSSGSGGSGSSSGGSSGSGSGSSGSGGSGSGDAEFRLRARGEAVINGVEAELRAEFRRRPDRTRLDGELEDINLPLGTPISFCLVQGSNTIPLAVGIIHLDSERKEAEFSLRTDDGERPPDVAAGNVLQARNGAAGGSADCGKPLLVSATFVPDN